MIEPISPIVHIWINKHALTRWCNGTSMPRHDEVQFSATVMPHYVMISIKYKTYQDLLAYFEESFTDDLPF
jgi:hypothetical protein